MCLSVQPTRELIGIATVAATTESSHKNTSPAVLDVLCKVVTYFYVNKTIEEKFTKTGRKWTVIKDLVLINLKLKA